MIRIKELTLAVILLASTFTAFAQTVNVNTADAKTLANELVGVGDARAALIVAYREANGPFSTLEELTNIKGIGPATLERNRSKIKLK